MSNLAKRPADMALVAVAPNIKRTRNEVDTIKDQRLMELNVNRTSNLFAPIMKFDGHESEVFTCEFHPDGDFFGKITK